MCVCVHARACVHTHACAHVCVCVCSYTCGAYPLERFWLLWACTLPVDHNNGTHLLCDTQLRHDMPRFLRFLAYGSVVCLETPIFFPCIINLGMSASYSESLSEICRLVLISLLKNGPILRQMFDCMINGMKHDNTVILSKSLHTTV